jgi:hypothetical protein
MIGWQHYASELGTLGKYNLSGKSCLAIKSIENIDIKVLHRLIKISCEEMKKRYKTA